MVEESLSRDDARELAFRLLFAGDCGGLSARELLEGAEDLQALPPDSRAYVEKLVRGVSRFRKSLDRRYAPVLEGWTVERLSGVERTLLRIALYEITRGLTPPEEVIRAVRRLAEQYGEESAPTFLEGVLRASLER